MNHIIAVPAFADNYIWLICDKLKKYAVIIDPGDSSPVLNYLNKNKTQAIAVLITHYHWDHTNGISELSKHYPQMTLYAPKRENISQYTQTIGEGDTIDFPELDLTFQVFDTPGHTKEHVSYYTGKHLFCGDTLFSCGCGRIFDSHAETLHDSLNRLSMLPLETQIYCTHEYTLDNIGFALWIEQGNPALLRRRDECYRQLDNNEATLPVTLATELQTNPFLRTQEQTVIASAEKFAKRRLLTSKEVFTTLRYWKDSVYD